MYNILFFHYYNGRTKAAPCDAIRTVQYIALLVLWDVTACNLIEIYHYFGGIWSFTFIVEDRRGYIFLFRNSGIFLPDYTMRHVSENSDVFVLECMAMLM